MKYSYGGGVELAYPGQKLCGPHVNYFNEKQLLKRGWTKAKIRHFLGEAKTTQKWPRHKNLLPAWYLPDVAKAEAAGALEATLPKSKQ